MKTFEQYVDEQMKELNKLIGGDTSMSYILHTTWLKWGNEYGELRDMWATERALK